LKLAPTPEGEREHSHSMDTHSMLAQLSSQHPGSSTSFSNFLESEDQIRLNFYRVTRGIDCFTPTVAKWISFHQLNDKRPR
jgi:hypothetical protein